MPQPGSKRRPSAMPAAAMPGPAAARRAQRDSELQESIEARARIAAHMPALDQRRFAAEDRRPPPSPTCHGPATAQSAKRPPPRPPTAQVLLQSPRPLRSRQRGRRPGRHFP